VSPLEGELEPVDATALEATDGTDDSTEVADNEGGPVSTGLPDAKVAGEEVSEIPGDSDVPVGTEMPGIE
jgi:hypothetical protein